MEPHYRYAARARTSVTVPGLVALAVLTVTAIACSSSAAPTTGDASPEASAERVVVEATEFGFAPSTIRIPAGKPVKVVLNNGGRIEHEILVRDPSMRIVATQVSHEMHSSGEAGMKEMSEHARAGRFHVHAGPGDEGSETLQAETPGTYDFACEIPGHKEAGMVGKIEVLP